MKRDYAAMVLMITTMALTNAILVYELWSHVRLATVPCLMGALQ